MDHEAHALVFFFCDGGNHIKAHATIGVGQGIMVRSQASYIAVQQLD